MLSCDGRGFDIGQPSVMCACIRLSLAMSAQAAWRGLVDAMAVAVSYPCEGLTLTLDAMPVVPCAVLSLR